MFDTSDASNSERARRAELQLLAPPRRPTRTSYVPTQRLPRRPGERREPLAVPQLAPALRNAATARGLELGCAAELCLERALVICDLVELDQLATYPLLLEVAETTAVCRALPAAKARYLQMLLAARDRGLVVTESEDNSGERVIGVPLRLFPRVLGVVDHGPLGAVELAEALQLEVAAVSEGRTMSEWAALTALRLSL